MHNQRPSHRMDRVPLVRCSHSTAPLGTKAPEHTGCDSSSSLLHTVELLMHYLCLPKPSPTSRSEKPSAGPQFCEAAPKNGGALHFCPHSRLSLEIGRSSDEKLFSATDGQPKAMERVPLFVLLVPGIWYGTTTIATVGFASLLQYPRCWGGTILY